MNGEIAYHHPENYGLLRRLQAEVEAVDRLAFVLESNVGIMERLRGYYTDIVKDSRFPVDGEDCLYDVRAFSSQLGELVFNINSQISRVKALSEFIKGRRTIVSPVSCIAQLSSSRTQAMS